MNKKLLLTAFIRLFCVTSDRVQSVRIQPKVVTADRVQWVCARVFLALLLVSVSTIGSADTEFSVKNYKGKIVYVDFWASWCIPCRASFPFMREMSEKYGESLVIAAINVDEIRADADRFLEDFTINFDIVYDPEGAIAQAFDVQAMPTSYLFDREGNLLGSHLGFRKKDIAKLEESIANAINTAGVGR